MTGRDASQSEPEPRDFAARRQLFEEAIVGAEQRREVRSRVAEDATTLALLDRWLAIYDRDLTVMEKDGSVATTSSKLVVDPDTDLRVMPSHIGPFELLEKIGEGGMGTVFRARQQVPVVRDVALKVIRPGLRSGRVLARFAAERQALARMSHPHIARILEAGTTAQGLPFFAMEYVSGQAITNFCESRNMAIGPRLELFVAVCFAVEHAHQRGIVHRDLKPSNILVADREGDFEPKIIDFGIAKALDREMPLNSLLTREGAFLGTPDFMPPEQAGGSASLDQRSDVYALGAVLYMLLIGRPPLPTAGIESPMELQRRILNDQPDRPSVGFAKLDDAAQVAGRRGTRSESLFRQLHGDLDWICLKALHKAPDRRYASAAELAADLECHLSDQPVSAGPPSRSYVLAKFARRHRARLFTVVAMALVLAIGLGIAAVASLRADRIEERARVDVSEKLHKVLVSLTQASASAAVSTGSGVVSSPLTPEARDEVRRQLDRFLASAKTPDNTDSRERQLRLATGLRNAAGSFSKAIDTMAPDDSQRDSLSTDAEAYVRHALTIEQKILGESHQRTLMTHFQLSQVHTQAGRYQSCVEELDRVDLPSSLAATLGRGDPQAIQVEALMGVCLHAAGQHQRALSHVRLARQGYGKLSGDAALSTVTMTLLLAEIDLLAGRLEAAQPLIEQAAAVSREARPMVSARHAKVEALLGLQAVGQGRLDAARRHLRQSISMHSQVRNHRYWTALPVIVLAQLELGAGRIDIAESMAKSALEAANFNREHFYFDVATVTHGRCLVALGRLTEAEPLLRQGFEGLRESFGAEHPLVVDAQRHLAALND